MKLTKQDSKVISKRLWNKDQDELLLSIVGKYSAPKWSSISDEFNKEVHKLPGNVHSTRTNKQCRERWQNHLNPTLKNHLPWSQDQHKALFGLFREYSHQWCVLACKLADLGFEKRSDNNIKNYFYSALKRQIKSINEIIRENNREIKKKKSIIHQYSQKYHYKQRLSLERQILGCRKQRQSNRDEQSSRNVYALNSSEAPAYPNSSQMCPQSSEPGDLHIVKELDQDLISKILLIAEEKADKKYVISNNHNHEYQEEAVKSRDQLIELIIEKDQPLNKGKVLNLAKQMLNISRKCKKKSNKGVALNIELNTKQTENKSDKSELAPEAQDRQPPLFKIAQEKVKKQIQPEFNEKATLQKLMQEDKFKMPEKNVELEKSSMDFGLPRDQVYTPYNVSFFPSYDYSRNLMDRSSELFGSGCFVPNPIYNSNIFGYFDSLPHKNNYVADNDNKGQDLKKDSFINQIRQIKPTPVPNSQTCQFAPVSSSNNNNLFSFPPVVRQEYEPNPDNSTFLANSWSYIPSRVTQDTRNNSLMFSTSGDKDVYRKNSDHNSANLSRSWFYQQNPLRPQPHKVLSNSMNMESKSNQGDEWAFNLPKSGFHKFEGQ